MSQGEIPGYILDASIAMKWYLDDEDHTSESDAILTAFREGQITLYAPDHIRYEVANALRNAVRRERIADARGREALSEFLSWQIPTVGGDALVRAGYEIAIRYSCALYDGLYLALAENTDLPLIHADLRLHNTLGRRFSAEVWIEDYVQKS